MGMDKVAQARVRLEKRSKDKAWRTAPLRWGRGGDIIKKKKSLKRRESRSPWCPRSQVKEVSRKREPLTASIAAVTPRKMKTEK